MEVTFDPQLEYHKLEDVVSEPAEPPLDRSGTGFVGDGAMDALQRLNTSPFQNHDTTADSYDANTPFRNGADFARMLSMKPDGVIEELGEKIVKRIGEVPSNDAEAKRFFGHKDMITLGFDTLDEANCQQEWKDYIHKRTKNAILPENHSLSESVTLAVYAVDLENAAAPLEEGVLTPLLKNVDEGSNSVDIWDVPAVRAIVEYKWHSWARRYLRIEFALYMAWLISFLAFLVLYIKHDLKRGFDTSRADQSSLWLLSVILDVCAAGFMLPFIAINIKSVIYYKWKWLHMWSVISFIAYILQTIIAINHLIGFKMDDDVYKSILAIQCTILFVKVQYFFRVVAVGASYIETLWAVVYDVRYFLAFIITGTVSASLSFAVLYSDHNDEKISTPGNATDIGTDDFDELPKSLVTTLAVLLGNFDPAYVFNAQHNVIKGMAFLLFLVGMSILVLNLFIAVVTQSYSKCMTKKRALYNKGRAQLIGELEVSLPHQFRRNFSPYIHFAVITRRDRKQFQLNAFETFPVYSDSISGLDARSKLKGIETLMTNLTSQLDMLQNQVKQLQNDVTMMKNVPEGS